MTRKQQVGALAYAYAELLRTYRSKPYPIDPDKYRSAISFRRFLDDQCGGNAYRFVTDQGWNFDRFRQAVLREARKLNCGPVQSWERF
ncbi:MAG: hypothetical protein GWN58_32950 [Anaerolineae bacterium]|nr:hypothetical protein [Thermoplasmata archaeon]NIV34084.1 hypothetical protein [Anaerolineae bacterium]NIY05935.1 hypothetical protein [Thermoplasmata archaeon]